MRDLCDTTLGAYDAEGALRHTALGTYDAEQTNPVSSYCGERGGTRVSVPPNSPSRRLAVLGGATNHERPVRVLAQLAASHVLCSAPYLGSSLTRKFAVLLT